MACGPRPNPTNSIKLPLILIFSHKSKSKARGLRRSKKRNDTELLTQGLKVAFFSTKRQASMTDFFIFCNQFYDFYVIESIDMVVYSSVTRLAQTRRVPSHAPLVESRECGRGRGRFQAGRAGRLASKGVSIPGRGRRQQAKKPIKKQKTKV